MTQFGSVRSYFTLEGTSDCSGDGHESEPGALERTLTATSITESPWGEGGFQHGSPPAALITFLLEAGVRDAGMDETAGRFARINVNLLGAVPLGELKGYVKVIRPGKRISMLEATVVANGREYIRGQGWWIHTADTTDIERAVDARVPSPDESEVKTEFLQRWSSGYIDSIHVLQAPAPQPGYDMHDPGICLLYTSPSPRD